MKLKHTLLASLFILTSPTASFADEASPFSGTLTLTSDYMFRGISQTDNGIALQGSFDYAHESGFYAGIWASNIDYDPKTEADIEIDVYIGFSGQITDSLGWGVLATRFFYPDGDSPEDYNEYQASMNYTGVENLDLTLALDYSDDVYGSSKDSYYYSLNGSYQVVDNWSVHAGYGYSDLDDAYDESYSDWKVGVGTSYSGFDFVLEYVDTSSDAEKLAKSSTTDGRVVFSISRSM